MVLCGDTVVLAGSEAFSDGDDGDTATGLATVSPPVIPASCSLCSPHASGFVSGGGVALPSSAFSIAAASWATTGEAGVLPTFAGPAAPATPWMMSNQRSASAAVC